MFRWLEILIAMVFGKKKKIEAIAQTDSLNELLTAIELSNPEVSVLNPYSYADLTTMESEDKKLLTLKYKDPLNNRRIDMAHIHWPYMGVEQKVEMTISDSNGLKTYVPTYEQGQKIASMIKRIVRKKEKEQREKIESLFDAYTQDIYKSREEMLLSELEKIRKKMSDKAQENKNISIDKPAKKMLA